MGSSLIYPPAFYAKTDELVELCKVASEYDGMYISHMRSEGAKFLEAIDELMELLAALGMSDAARQQLRDALQGNAGALEEQVDDYAGQQIAENMGGVNRIATNTNGTFKRIINGEQSGKPIRGEFNAIIIAMLAKPGRTYYASAYDPDAKPTLPDCWSHLGDTPDPKAENRQSANCASCKQNIEGSGTNGKGSTSQMVTKLLMAHGLRVGT